MSLWKLLGTPHRWYGSIIERVYQKWKSDLAEIERRRWKAVIERRVPLEELIQERIAIRELMRLVCDYLKYEIFIQDTIEIYPETRSTPSFLDYFYVSCGASPPVEEGGSYREGRLFRIYEFMEKPQMFCFTNGRSLFLFRAEDLLKTRAENLLKTKPKPSIPWSICISNQTLFQYPLPLGVSTARSNRSSLYYLSDYVVHRMGGVTTSKIIVIVQYYRDFSSGYEVFLHQMKLEGGPWFSSYINESMNFILSFDVQFDRDRSRMYFIFSRRDRWMIYDIISRKLTLRPLPFSAQTFYGLDGKWLWIQNDLTWHRYDLNQSPEKGRWSRCQNPGKLPQNVPDSLFSCRVLNPCDV